MTGTDLVGLEVMVDARVRAQQKTENQMRELLRLYRDEGLEPEPIAGMGELPANATKAMRELYDLLVLRFGLRLADGTAEPLPVSVRELVNEGIIKTPSGASKLLRRFIELRIIWFAEELPKLGKGDGTHCFLPGPMPANPFDPPLGGWCVEPASDGPASDDPPRPALDPGAVAVEAENVTPGVAVEPAVELVDEAGVSDAVRGGAADALDVVPAASGRADGGMVDPVLVGHGAKSYGRRTTLGGGASVELLLKQALGKARVGTRNKTGFDLACQLRDNDHSSSEAMAVLRRFRDRVPQPDDDRYALAAAMRSVGQAYRRPPREPWGR